LAAFNYLHILLLLVSIGLVFSIHDSTTEEVAIQKMIDASQRMITIMNSQGEGISPPIKKHLELEIKTLENAPRDADKLEWLLQAKQKQKEEAMYIEETQRLVTEIEMLKVVLRLILHRGVDANIAGYCFDNLRKKDKR
jgi:hypothetical protein